MVDESFDFHMISVAVSLKPNKNELCLNKGMAPRRLEEQYDHQIVTLLEVRFAEETDEDEIAWFLPHHGVFHSRKSDSVRVVFDCDARARGLGLNDFILNIVVPTS